MAKALAWIDSRGEGRLQGVQTPLINPNPPLLNKRYYNVTNQRSIALLVLKIVYFSQAKNYENINFTLIFCELWDEYVKFEIIYTPQILLLMNKNPIHFSISKFWNINKNCILIIYLFKKMCRLKDQPSLHRQGTAYKENA